MFGVKLGFGAPGAVTDARAEASPPVSPRMRFRIICVAAENCGTYGGRLALGDENDLLPLPMVVDVVLVVVALLAGDMTGRVTAMALALGASELVPSSCASFSFGIELLAPGIESDILQVNLV